MAPFLALSILILIYILTVMLCSWPSQYLSIPYRMVLFTARSIHIYTLPYGCKCNLGPLNTFLYLTVWFYSRPSQTISIPYRTAVFSALSTLIYTWPYGSIFGPLNTYLYLTVRLYSRPSHSIPIPYHMAVFSALSILIYTLPCTLMTYKFTCRQSHFNAMYNWY